MKNIDVFSWEILDTKIQLYGIPVICENLVNNNEVMVCTLIKIVTFLFVFLLRNRLCVAK